MIRQTLARIFAAASGRYLARYDTHEALVTSLSDAVVVSIGNIAVGGRGKSPLACHVANWYAQQGWPTALLLRGYKGKMESSGGLVSPGDGPVVTAAQAGDEAFAAAMLCESVQVRVGKDRISQGKLARDTGVSVIVLDDGFQHRKMARNLDIVSISPEDVAGDATFFPKGKLRESPGGLSRADLLVGYAEDWANRTDGPAVLFHHHPAGLLSTSFQAVPKASAPSRMHVLCGIEVPARFVRTVREAGFVVTSSSVFGDHHVYSAGDLRRVVASAIENGAEAVLTTTKDLARLSHIPDTLPFFALQTRLRFTTGESKLIDALASQLPRFSLSNS